MIMCMEDMVHSVLREIDTIKQQRTNIITDPISTIRILLQNIDDLQQFHMLNIHHLLPHISVGHFVQWITISSCIVKLYLMCHG